MGKEVMACLMLSHDEDEAMRRPIRVPQQAEDETLAEEDQQARPIQR